MDTKPITTWPAAEAAFRDQLAKSERAIVIGELVLDHAPGTNGFMLTLEEMGGSAFIVDAVTALIEQERRRIVQMRKGIALATGVAPAHPAVTSGDCYICGHVGDDCTGTRPADPDAVCACDHFYDQHNEGRECLERTMEGRARCSCGSFKAAL